jgi:parallel beta-helix repeat protein
MILTCGLSGSGGVTLRRLMLAALVLAAGALPAGFASAATVLEADSFGAKGDGATDDTAAIQAAVDKAHEQGGAVHIRKGRYLVGSIELSSNVTVYGDGQAATVLILRPQPLRRAKDAPGHLFLPKDMKNVASVENVVIRDLALEGNSARQNDGKPMPLSGGLHGIAILGGRKWLVQRVLAEDFDGDGIYLGRNLNHPSNPPAQGNVVENCIVRKNLRNGMMISHGDANVLRNNLFEGNQVGMACNPAPEWGGTSCPSAASYPKFAPAVYGSAELDLEPNRIGVVDGTMAWERVTNTSIEGNTFRAGNRLAIQMVKGAAEISGTNISNNSFIDNRYGQIYMFSQGAHDNLISNNKFVITDPSIATFFIRLKGGSNNRIVGNTFSGALGARPGGVAISIESAMTSGDTPRCSEFSGNTLDFGSGAGSRTVAVAKEVQDVVIFNNNFANHSGSIRVDGPRQLQSRETCR